MSTSDRRSFRLRPGTVIRGTYTIDEFVGSGAFGAVYKVRHRFLGTQAMKVFFPTGSPVDRGTLIEEAQLLSALVHENIVRLFEANTIDDSDSEIPYITMEYIAGGTLEEFLERKVRLHPLSALKVARQICGGLAVAHSTSPPIVHRDITARNVLVYAVSVHGTPQVKVGDFGLARHVDPDSLMSSAAGTLSYMAPEAAWGYCSASSDVYSVGVVLYRMLTGLFPFPLPDDADLSTPTRARDLVLNLRKKMPPPPSAFRMGLPNQIDGMVQKSLHPDPIARYSNAKAFGHDLDMLIGEYS